MPQRVRYARYRYPFLARVTDRMDRRLVSVSKFLSLVLRHEPGLIGLSLSPQGWVPIAELLLQAAAHGKPVSREELDQIVAQNDKQRFSISDDGLQIRAAQGHSVTVELGLAALAPPPQLYHGTATRFVDAIRSQGLLPQSRQQVHLSADIDTALTVGARHGKPVVFVVDAQRMHAAGLPFYLADNGVWLTDAVAPEFLQLLAG